MQPHLPTAPPPGHTDLAIEKNLDTFLQAACEAIGVPKAQPDSFALHAPLEVLARYRLMNRLNPGDRHMALGVAHTVIGIYQKAGSPLSFHNGYPTAIQETETVALARLHEALDNGNVGLCLSLSRGLSRTTNPVMLCRATADLVVTHLGCAGHAGIYFHHLQHIPYSARHLALQLFPGFATGLAQASSQRVHLQLNSHNPSSDTPASQAMAGLLLDLPPLAGARTSGIAVMVRQAIDAGHLDAISSLIAQMAPDDLLQQQDTYEAICGVAALSMLQEADTHARYGWTHCLTLPQGVWSLRAYLNDPREALCMAALYVAAFRSCIGQTRLRPRPLSGPALASASVTPDFAPLVRSVCMAQDAHLVKYVLACMDEALRFPRLSPLLLSAAQRLNHLWAHQRA